MAYFANGTEGDYYEEKYCQRCAHFGECGEECPILALHGIWNYEACRGDQPESTAEQRAKHVALNMLWPRDGVHNGACKMFCESPQANDETKDTVKCYCEGKPREVPIDTVNMALAIEALGKRLDAIEATQVTVSPGKTTGGKTLGGGQIRHLAATNYDKEHTV